MHVVENGKMVGNELKSNLTGEASQVEVVLDEVLIDFAEEFVAFQAAEPGYPGGDLLFAPADFLAAATLRACWYDVLLPLR